MISLRLLPLFLTLVFLGSGLFAAIPEFLSTPPAVVDVRLQNRAWFNSPARCADNHYIVYQWEIVADPTDVVYFQSPTTGSSARLAFPWLNGGSGPQPIGSEVQIRVTASHGNPAVDGQASTSYQFKARIVGVNLPPAPVITGYFGTPTSRLRPGDAIVADAGDSTDPDATGFRAEWLIGPERGGRFVQRPTPIGVEGTLMTMTVPPIIGGDVELDVTLVLLDGMHDVRATRTAYMRPSLPPTPNLPPILSLPAMIYQRPGETVTIWGTAEDLEADNCSFSFLQVGVTTTVPVVTPVSTWPTRKWSILASHPPLPVGDHLFEIRATETSTVDHKQSSATVLVVVRDGDWFDAPWYAVQTSGCSSGNTPPALQFSPDIFEAKASYAAGQEGRIELAATDYTETMPGSTGTSITWLDLGQLFSLGADPRITPSTTDPYFPQRSSSTLSFLAPHRDGTTLVTAKAEDKLCCSTTVTFAIRFDPGPADNPPAARIRYGIDGESLRNALESEVLELVTDKNHTIALDGSTSNDVEGPIASYLWSIAENLPSSGIALAGAASSTTSLTIPEGLSGTLTIQLTVRDSAQTENQTSIRFFLRAPSAPTARIRYRLGSVGPFMETPSNPVVLDLRGGPLLVTFDASTSTDPQGGTLTYAWSRDIQGLTSSADTVSPLAGWSSPTSTITFSGSARGIVIIRLKTRDGANEEGTASITFNLQAPSRSSPWRPRRGNGR